MHTVRDAQQFKQHFNMCFNFEHVFKAPDLCGLKDTLKSFAEQGMVMGLHIHSGLVCVLSASAQTADKEPYSPNNQSA